MRTETIQSPSVIDLRPPRDDFETGFLHGLSRDPKQVPCKFLYDARGSSLFEEICDLPEYYPTRTETLILEKRIDEIGAMLGERAFLIELGSGSSAKTRLLLDRLRGLSGYVPIDISKEQLRASASRLQTDYPWLRILPVCADYTGPLTLPAVCDEPDGERVIFFPGSTIGNFEPADARRFMERIRNSCGPHGFLLIGADLKKSRHILEAAYNDRAGTTARFNLNLLARANREIGATFDLSAFRHGAIYNERFGRIEMHLVSRKNQAVKAGGKTFRFFQGESIVTEHSYKYDQEEFRRLATASGYTPLRSWTDPRELFSVHLLRF